MPSFTSQGTCFSDSYGSDLLELNQYITAMKLNGISVSEIDVTALSSDWKSYVMGTIDFGTLEVEFTVPSDMIYAHLLPTIPGPNPAGNGDVTGSFFLAIRFGLGYCFFTCTQAWLTKVSMSAAVDDAVRGAYTFRLSSNAFWQ
jgi:hypothetical protein